MAQRAVRRRRRTTSTATIRDVANAAAVSTATVSRVLAGNYPVAKETRKRVLEAIEELDYTANVHARGLSGGAQGPIAVLLGDITGPSFAALAQGVEREARARGRLCLVGTTESDPEREVALLELMREQQAAGVVLPGGSWNLPAHEEQVIRFARSFRAAGGRIVLCGRPELAEPDSGAATIRYENESGAAAVARLTVAAGHRRFLLLPGMDGYSTAEERLRGFRSVLTEGGIADADITVRHATFTRESARRAILRALDEQLARGDAPFTAVLSGSDIMAAGVLEALRSRGLRCPDDISVTGYDDIPGAADMNPALTTVRVPYEEMGALAVRCALTDDRTETNAPLPTTVVERDSVAPPPQPAG